jgi:hypothetical protein
MSDSYEAYPEAQAPTLSAQGARRAVLEYATDFISRGDIDVMFTLSGGLMGEDGQSADPAVWADWVAAWRRAVSRGDEPPHGDRPGGPTAVDMQWGYRAFRVFLESNYEPIDETPMSVVRDDCEAVLSDAAARPGGWGSWLEAIAEGKSADPGSRFQTPGR